MNDQSTMSRPKTYEDLFSAISLRELASGALLCVWPDGRITERYGREVARASLSPALAKALGLMTSGTYGPPSNGLSRTESRTLSLSLANRLRARTDSIGSILYRLTWKDRVTPSGRSIPALRASVLRISDKGSTGSLTGWATPVVRDHRNSAGDGSNPRDIPRQASLCGWPTPCQQDGPNGGPNQGVDRLPGAVSMAGWPTPQAGNPGTETYNPAGNTDSSRKTCAIAMTIEYRFIPSHTGQTPTGCCVVIPTERVSGPLNPAHSLWLMLGPFSTDWLKCGERVTRSTSRKHKGSSKR